MQTHQPPNIAAAAAPEAIASSPPPKEPLSNNDPTRDVSPRQSLQRTLVVALAFAAVALMAFAIIWLVVEPR